MTKPKLLEELEKQTANELLKALLAVHNPSPEMSQEQKVSILVTKLEEIFEGRLDETNKH